MSIWMSAAPEWYLEQERKAIVKILEEEGIAVPDCLSGSFLAGVEESQPNNGVQPTEYGG